MRHFTFQIALVAAVTPPTITQGQTDPAAQTGIAVFAAPAVTREGYAVTPLDDLEPEALIKLRIYDVNDNWIGEVSGLIFDASDRAVGAVVDVGGFLGMGERSVAIRLDSLTALQTIEGDRTRLYLAASDTALDALPDHGG